MTDPLIKRLGLEAELQVDDPSMDIIWLNSLIVVCICIRVDVEKCIMCVQGHTGCVNCLEWNEKGE